MSDRDACWLQQLPLRTANLREEDLPPGRPVEKIMAKILQHNLKSRLLQSRRAPSTHLTSPDHRWAWRSDNIIQLSNCRSDQESWGSLRHNNILRKLMILIKIHIQLSKIQPTKSKLVISSTTETHKCRWQKPKSWSLWAPSSVMTQIQAPTVLIQRPILELLRWRRPSKSVMGPILTEALVAKRELNQHYHVKRRRQDLKLTSTSLSPATILVDLEYVNPVGFINKDHLHLSLKLARDLRCSRRLDQMPTSLSSLALSKCHAAAQSQTLISPWNYQNSESPTLNRSRLPNKVTQSAEANCR